MTHGRVYISLFVLCIFSCTVTALLEHPQFSDLKVYEIIEPIAVTTDGNHHKWRRAVQKHVHNDKLEFILNTKLKKYNLLLTVNKQIIHPDFQLTYQTPNDTLKFEKPTIQNCHYHGTLSEENSKAAISICDGGLSGRFITSSGENIFIEPLHNRAGRHIIFKSSDVISNSSVEIDKQPEVVSKNIDNYIRFRRSLNSSTLLNQTKVMTISFVVDKTFYNNQDSSMNKSITKVLKIVNHMDLIYKTINLRIAIISLDVWNLNDVFAVSNITSSNLHLFNNYNLNELIIKRKGKHDNAQMLSGIDQVGSLIGLAGVGTMCTDSSAAFCQDIGNAGVTANVVAHELGHNLGFRHNNWWCVCDVEPCVMNVYASWTAANGFTDCSKEMFDEITVKGKYQCLFDVPTKLYGDPICGNGFLEEGEHCDCGTVEECTDSCCNVSSCTLLGDAKCSSGTCCENCQFKPQGTVCRSVMGECDLEEHCTGVTHLCPDNYYKQDFISCSNNTGYCWEGVCGPSYTEQCKELWGPNAYKGDDSCYSNLNIGANDFGNCGTNDTGEYVKCEPENVKCGYLQCTGENLPTFPIIGTNRKMSNFYYNVGSKSVFCRAGSTFLGYDIKDPTVVKSGTRCSDGKVCYNKKCSDVMSLSQSVIPCKNECFNGGICNNNGNCHCLLGFACPNCQFPGRGGSVDSGMECYRSTTVKPITITQLRNMTEATTERITSETGNIGFVVGAAASVVVIICIVLLIGFRKRQRIKRYLRMRKSGRGDSDVSEMMNEDHNNNNNPTGDTIFPNNAFMYDHPLFKKNLRNKPPPYFPHTFDQNGSTSNTFRRASLPVVNHLLPPLLDQNGLPIIIRRGSMPVQKLFMQPQPRRGSKPVLAAIRTATPATGKRDNAGETIGHHGFMPQNISSRRGSSKMLDVTSIMETELPELLSKRGSLVLVPVELIGEESKSWAVNLARHLENVIEGEGEPKQVDNERNDIELREKSQRGKSKKQPVKHLTTHSNRIVPISTKQKSTTLNSVSSTNNLNTKLRNNTLDQSNLGKQVKENIYTLPFTRIAKKSITQQDRKTSSGTKKTDTSSNNNTSTSFRPKIRLRKASDIINTTKQNAARNSNRIHPTSMSRTKNGNQSNALYKLLVVLHGKEQETSTNIYEEHTEILLQLLSSKCRLVQNIFATEQRNIEPYIEELLEYQI